MRVTHHCGRGSRLLAAFAFLCGCASAQLLHVGSEFIRYTPTGEIFPQDKVACPVEALSPPLVRGVWNSFRIVVEVEPGAVFRLYTAQNPENAMQTRIFREVVTKDSGGWQIARREFSPQPFRNNPASAAEAGKTQTTYTFWLDVRPPRDYPAERLKLEAQILLDGQWFIHPMEIRVIDLDLPGAPPGQGDLPETTLGPRTADLPYRDVVRQFVCATPEAQGRTLAVKPGTEGALEMHAARSFDFILDALVRAEGRTKVAAIVNDFLGIDDATAWCRKPIFPNAAYGPEWPVYLRNRLLRLRGNPQ